MNDQERGEILTETVFSWVKALLVDNLVGVYFHGSLRLGGFNWNKSDLDFIIVVHEKLDAKIKTRLWSVFLSHEDDFPAKGFEFSVVLLENCRVFKYPTPYDLHGSRDWVDAFRSNPLQVVNDKEKFDYDLASHFGVIRAKQAPKLDYGAAMETVFGEVPIKDVLDSNWRDIQHARSDIVKNPVYMSLNLCRFAALAKESKILSKEAGGEWIKTQQFDLNYRIVDAALAEYKGGDKMYFSESELVDFAKQMMDIVHKYYHPEDHPVDC